MALHLPPVKYIAALVSNISHADQLILVQRLIFIIWILIVAFILF